MALRLIHIGVGLRGRHWLDIVSHHPDFVSVACVDPDEKALGVARSLPGQEHGRFFASVAEALAHVGAEYHDDVGTVAAEARRRFGGSVEVAEELRFYYF